MRYYCRIFALFVCFCIFSYHVHGQQSNTVIKNKLKEISSLIGNWTIKGTLLGSEETGKAEIKWILDSTYFQWDTEVYSASNKSTRKFSAFITYSPVKQTFQCTTFYAGTDFTVFHHKGNYDAVTKRFSREAVNHFPDRGDELVKNIIDLSETGKFSFLSYQSKQSLPEQLVYESTFTRIP